MGQIGSPGKESIHALSWRVGFSPRAQENIDKKAAPEDWRYREAATSAFGAILEGPSTEKLAQYVAAGLGFLLNAMKDPNQQVRHTTAWTIGAPDLAPCRMLGLLL